jgi:hypothetical protein
MSSTEEATEVAEKKKEGFRYLDLLITDEVGEMRTVKNGIVASYRLDPDAGILHVGLSFRNPLDGLNRPRGRFIAEARRLSTCGRPGVVHTIPFKDGDFIKQAIGEYINSGEVKLPRWAEGAKYVNMNPRSD